MTIFTRDASRLKNLSPPEHLQVRQVDYDSLDSLENALQGQDAIVCTIAWLAVPKQKLLIDAAVNTDLKFYIPAEYTIETREQSARQLPLYSSVVDIQNYLAAKDKIGWAVVSVGLPLENAFVTSFVVDFENKHATLWEAGEGRVSIGSFALAGKAAAGILKNPSKVKDHSVHVHGNTVSQNQILQWAEKASSSKWTTEHKEPQPAIDEAAKALQAASQDPAADQGAMIINMITMVAAETFGTGYFDGAYKTTDNNWLGIDYTISDQDIEDAVKARVKSLQAPGGDSATATMMSDLGSG